MDLFQNPPPYEKKKRSRMRLSCTACRQKKLKCDRLHPCDNCAKRGQSESCQYNSPEPSSFSQSHQWSENADVRARLRHLEELVLSLRKQSASNLKDGAGTTETPIAGPNKPGKQADPRGLSENTSTQRDYADSPGRMLVNKLGTRYVDATHWQAMLNEITEVKEYVQKIQDATLDTATDSAAREVHGPKLLLGTSQSMTKSDLLASLPPRRVVDKLASQYFNSKEPTILIIHVPTFQREYAEFWDDPTKISVTWLGLLYAIMCSAVTFYRRAGDILPDGLGDALEVGDIYRTRVAQCLVLANYTTPGRYKVETLLLYFGAEFLSSKDAQIGISILLSILVRLAMHMGYHRDSKHYRNLTVFEGEMRRRVWAVILQVDSLISFQTGLSKTISGLHCDTEPPSNMLDGDFHEETSVLPTARPETERTPVTYTIFKGRLMFVFGQIADRTYSSVKIPYDEVTRLDKSLQDAHASLPAFLKICPMNLSITDPTDLIMQRYNLELLYQKARCVLHRRYLMEARSNLRYIYSRWACVDAAKQILRHQYDIYNGTLPGGQLHRDRWFVSSLTTHDFLQAAMILCLDLSSELRYEPQLSHANQGEKGAPESRRERLEALETSYVIWRALRDQSADANKAAAVLEVILGKAMSLYSDSDEAVASSSPNQHTVPNIDHAAYKQRFAPQAEAALEIGLGHRTDKERGQTTPDMEVSSSGCSQDLGRNANIREFSIPEAIEGITDTDGEFDWVSSLIMSLCGRATSELSVMACVSILL
ncbi:hypothetical protein ACHAQJ_009312 [Trichoderma viride]